MRTSKTIYIPHRFVAVSNRKLVTKSIACNTCGRALTNYVKLVIRAVVSPSARFDYASASLSTHLDSTMAHAANFTHSPGIVIIPHLLHILLLLYSLVKSTEFPAYPYYVWPTFPLKLHYSNCRASTVTTFLFPIFSPWSWSTLDKVHPLTDKQKCAEHASSRSILWLGSYLNQQWRVSFDLQVLTSPPRFSLSNIFLRLADCNFPLYFPKRLHESLSRCNYFLPTNTSTKSKC